MAVLCAANPRPDLPCSSVLTRTYPSATKWETGLVDARLVSHSVVVSVDNMNIIHCSLSGWHCPGKPAGTRKVTARFGTYGTARGSLQQPSPNRRAPAALLLGDEENHYLLEGDASRRNVQLPEGLP